MNSKSKMLGRVPGRSSAYPDEKDWEKFPFIFKPLIMKTILLCIITSIFFISCSADSDFQAQEKQSGIAGKGTAQIQYPSNPENPFDQQGREIYRLLDLYHQKNASPNSVSELARQIRFLMEGVNGGSGKSGRLIPFTDDLVQSIMDDPDNSMILIVQNSVLQSYAKESLIIFLQELIVKRQEVFSVTNSYIIGYEAQVLDDADFTSEEAETILTVASISRYSLYSEEERKDKDWDILVGNRSCRPFFEANEAPLVRIISLLGRLI
ncbi:hypothetical protein [Flavobacterium sp. KACC 22763]|uniref:hypothetical protein n=1 Tax=Flavobacterium sp. KACC 22763 TaxID=3025668 RepID=UPI0023665F75|nr:hypothetical protein [Flavobacterium sp. KACC 22763]WDF66103.1 hypothetical protein PQ463_08040 [Flavobacterium sp. KACC 22763]